MVPTCALLRMGSGKCHSRHTECESHNDLYQGPVAIVLDAVTCRACVNRLVNLFLFAYAWNKSLRGV